MKKFFIAAGLIGIAFASCKKSDDNGGGSNNSAIVAKWNLNNIVTSTSLNGGTPSVDTAAMPGSTVEFKTDGKVYTLLADPTGNEYDTSYYSVNGSTVTVMSLDHADTTVMQITTLNNNTLNLYNTYTETQSGMTIDYKEWSYLSK